MLNKKQDVKLWMLYTHGAHPLSAWLSGRWDSSKSPWVNAMSHQMTAKKSHDKMKLSPNVSKVQRHCVSTKVVKMSCRNLKRFWDNFDWTILHSPFLRMALFRYFFAVPGRSVRFLSEKSKTKKFWWVKTETLLYHESYTHSGASCSMSRLSYTLDIFNCLSGTQFPKAALSFVYNQRMQETSSHSHDQSALKSGCSSTNKRCESLIWYFSFQSSRSKYWSNVICN